MRVLARHGPDLSDDPSWGAGAAERRAPRGEQQRAWQESNLLDAVLETARLPELRPEVRRWEKGADPPVAATCRGANGWTRTNTYRV